MIDYEVKIFNNVYEAVASMCAPKRFLSTPIDSYTKLPAASLCEIDNTTVRRRQSSVPIENFARIAYQAETAAATKTECRKIYKAMDDRMIALNFSKISGQYITYPDNPNVVRYVARYEAEIDRDGNIYRMSAW